MTHDFGGKIVPLPTTLCSKNTDDSAIIYTVLGSIIKLIFYFNFLSEWEFRKAEIQFIHVKMGICPAVPK